MQKQDKNVTHKIYNINVSISESHEFDRNRMKQANNKRTKNASTPKSFFLFRNNQNYDKDIQSQL